VVAHLSSENAAIKIRRLDADRTDLFHEAEMLGKANMTHSTPRLMGVNKNFLLMQLINGDLLPKWLENNKNPTVVKRVLGDIIEACYRLDQTGLDHGELSNAPKHVIIDHQMKPWILDFETASEKRKTANVPAICHFLFNSFGETARTVATLIGEPKTKEIIESLHVYKRLRSRENFDRVILSCLG